MKKCLLAFLFVICFIPVFSQAIYNGALATTDPTFARPDAGIPPTTVSDIGTNVYYDVIPINITVAGLVTISCNSLWDNFSILYNQDGFNAASPLDNALLSNDDYGGPNSGFTYNFASTGTYYLVICSFKNDVTGSYSIFQSTTIVLPLRLVAFTAGKAGSNSNIIKWSSAGENNLIAYQVQRSYDINNFSDLKNGRIAAKNNSTATAYNFTDNEPARGYNYYRLKITEGSGHISYSPVVLVKNIKPGITDLHIFPNPSSDFLKIEVKSMQNKKAFISVINSIGEIMSSNQYSFNNQAVLSVDIKKLPAGKYFLKTTVDNEDSTVVFIKN